MVSKAFFSVFFQKFYSELHIGTLRTKSSVVSLSSFGAARKSEASCTLKWLMFTVSTWIYVFPTSYIIYSIYIMWCIICILCGFNIKHIVYKLFYTLFYYHIIKLYIIAYYIYILYVSIYYICGFGGTSLELTPRAKLQLECWLDLSELFGKTVEWILFLTSPSSIWPSRHVWQREGHLEQPYRTRSQTIIIPFLTIKIDLGIAWGLGWCTTCTSQELSIF